MIEEFKKEKHLKPIDKIKQNPKYLKYQLDKHEGKAFPIALLASSTIAALKFNQTKFLYKGLSNRITLSLFYFICCFSLTHELIKRNYSDRSKAASLEEALLAKSNIK